MADFYVAGPAASAALGFLTIPPIITFWVFALQRPPHGPIQSAPTRMAHLFLRISPPFYALGVLLSTIQLALVASYNSSRSSVGSRGLEAAGYLARTSQFLTVSSTIGITIALYTSCIGCFYVAQGRKTWWRLFRVDAPVGAAILLVFAIAYYGRRMAVYADPYLANRSDLRVAWLVIIIELTFIILAAGVFGVMIYVSSKIRDKGEFVARAMGRAPAMMIAASALWVLRSSYLAGVIIKTIYEEWTIDEDNALLFHYVFLEYAVAATVMGLLVFVVRARGWADPGIQPQDNSGATGSQGPQMVHVVQVPAPGAPLPPGQYPQQPYPVYGQPPQGQAQQMYVYPQGPLPQPQPGQQVYYTNLPPPGVQGQPGQGQPQVVYAYPPPGTASPPAQQGVHQ